MIRNNKKIAQLVEKEFGISSKESKHTLEIITQDLIEIADHPDKIKEFLPRLARLLGLKAESTLDRKKIDDFIKIIINS